MNENNADQFPEIVELQSKKAVEPVFSEVNGTTVVVLPPGWTQIDLEGLEDQPIRTREEIDLRNFESLVEYVNRFKQDGTIIEVHSKASNFSCTAFIDYHDPGEGPGWCEHSASYKAQMTAAWRAWNECNNQSMRQRDFADFLYRNQAEVVSPNGADLLEVIETLVTTAKGEFQDLKDIHTGSQQLVYRMKVSAQGGTDKPIDLPKQFEIKVRPFYGCPEISLTADLMIETPRKDGDPVFLRYRFYRTEDVFEKLFDELAQKLRETTEVPVFIC